MARKKKTKTTQYTKNRNRILAYIRRQKKKNLVTDLYIPTEREVRKQGVKGKELAKLTRQLKGLTPKTLESQFYNPFEEPRYWTREDAENNKSQLPNGGYTSYRNVYDDFLSKLSEPIKETRRHPTAKYASERSQSMLLSLTNLAVQLEGEETVGWRLHNEPGLYRELDYVLYGSQAELINALSSRLANIIKGSPLTGQESRDLSEESEMNENWEMPE